MVLTDLHPLEQAALTQLALSVNKVFVTGAGGFLGLAICQRLLAVGIQVVGFARGDYPRLVDLGVDMRQGDISDYDTVKQAMQSYYSPNVDGANNIINACKALHIQRLVYTSTPSVTFAGRDENGINESAPYAETYLNYYGESKAIAEQHVLVANSAQLHTTALRPHLIWGPNDPHLVPRVIERARAGRLKLVGHEDKLVDTIYVDNAAYAHVLAALDLVTNAKCAGKAYFLSNDQPITMADMLNRILACVDLQPVTKRVPAGVAYSAGVVLETVYGLLNKSQEPIMTRFVARQLSTSHYFDISAAKQDLGYQPLVSIDQGMQKLKQSLTS